MKILVTGGAGFIGSHLVDELVNKDYEVVVLDNLSTGNKNNLNKSAKFYKLDIQDKKISKIFEKEKPEAVFHLAAQINVRASAENPILDANINILGSLNILENCKKYGFKKIIFTSSGGTIYGKANVFPTSEDSLEAPFSPYGIAKLSVEKYLNYYRESFGLDFVSLRLANVYGPRQNPKGEAGVVSIFCDKILGEKQPIINGDGKQTRDYVFVKDVVDAAILALENKKAGIFNVGTGKETDVNYIFSEIKKLLNSDCKEAHGPANTGELARSCLDFSKIKQALGWESKYNLEQGLKETVEWFESQK